MTEEMKAVIRLLGSHPEHVYDYIANNYYKMTKEELKMVLLEALYAIYYCSSRDYEPVYYQSMYEELNDRLIEYEDYNSNSEL